MTESENPIRLLLGMETAAAATDLRAWQERLKTLAEAWPSAGTRALLGGAEASCIAFAFAAGYQAALERMLGSAEGRPFRALCVTERAGNRPRDIRTTLQPDDDGWRLDGEKTYVTGGTLAAQLCIAARIDGSPEDRPALRMVCVPAARAGIQIDALPALSYLTELPHAALALAKVRVEQAEVLPGDGYTKYVKPFRTIEDIHVELALLGFVVRHLRPLAHGRACIERALALIATLLHAATLPPLDPATHLVLAGHRAALDSLLAELDTAWEHADPAFHSLWLRDRRLFGVASAARVTRTARAWDSLDAPSATDPGAKT